MRYQWRFLSAVVLLLSVATTGHPGVTFDAVDDRIAFGDLTAYDFADQSFTVVAWFKTTTNGANQYLIARRAISGGNGGWLIRIGSDGTATIRIVNIDNVQAAQRASTASVADGTLKSLAVVFTTNTTTLASNDVTIYVNGTQNQGSRSDSGGNPYHACTASCTLMGGALSDLSGEFFGGTIDAIQIYPVALTQEEITTLGLGQLQRPGLSRSATARWPLEACADGTAGDGVTMPDRSGNGRDGTVSRGANGSGATCVATSALSIPWGPQ